MDDLLVELGAVPAVAQRVAAELRERHEEAHRRYHDLVHVGEVLAEIDRLLPHEPEADPPAVRLAAWFHDAIYEPVAPPGESESLSADLALDLLPAFDTTDRDRLADEVARLVRLTAAHSTGAGDRSGAVLIDADLWILSATPERYAEYVAGVRQEYDFVPDEVWADGRGRVLRRFLDGLAGIYLAGPLDDRELRRDRAALNLQRELDGLCP